MIINQIYTWHQKGTDVTKHRSLIPTHMP